MKSSSLLCGLLFGFANASHLATRDAQAKAACPATVVDGDIAPYAIVPVSKSDPNKAFGTTDRAIITPGDICTWFAFATPADLPNSLCVLSFLFPNDPDVAASSYNISGAGNFDIRAQFYVPGDTDIYSGTTWQNQPKGAAQAGAIQSYQNKFSPAGVTAVSTGQCSRTGSTSQMFVRVCSNDTNFSFTESTSQCPLGMFVLMFPKRGGSSTGTTGTTSTRV